MFVPKSRPRKSASSTKEAPVVEKKEEKKKKVVPEEEKSQKLEQPKNNNKKIVQKQQQQNQTKIQKKSAPKEEKKQTIQPTPQKITPTKQNEPKPKSPKNKKEAEAPKPKSPKKNVIAQKAEKMEEEEEEEEEEIVTDDEEDEEMEDGEKIAEDEVEYKYTKSHGQASKYEEEEEEEEEEEKPKEEEDEDESAQQPLFGRGSNKLKAEQTAEDDETKIPSSPLTVKVLNTFATLPVEVLSAALEQSGLPKVTDEKISPSDKSSNNLCYFDKSSGFIQTPSQDVYDKFIKKRTITFNIPTLDEHTLVFLPSIPRSEKNALIITDLAPEMNAEILNNYVSEFGKVTKTIIFEPVSQQFKKTASAYVEFETALQDSVLGHSGAEILGKLCVIEFYDPDSHNLVMVSNLPQNEPSEEKLTEKELKMYFEEVGAVDFVIFQKNRDGLFNGVGFVRFKSILACKSVQDYSNSTIHGKQCQIVFLAGNKKTTLKIIKQ